MKAAIYDPYLDTLGGGERYSMAVATTLVALGYKVDVEWSDVNIKDKLTKRFGIDLKNVNFVEKVNRGDGYDICFWVSDGSVPTLRARKNFLHFQVPFKDVGGKSLINRMKFFRIKKVICNSYFTKSFIDKEYGVASEVLYPPVDVERIKPLKKENWIVYVGRFSQLQQSKGQEYLIRAFKRFYELGMNDWRLVLAGGSDVGGKEYLAKVKRISAGYPIDIYENPDFKKIKEILGKGKIFWSASGFGINPDKEPRKVEHFGISAVEAMAANEIPFLFAAGGHKEIVKEGISGSLWRNPGELVKTTMKLVNDKKRMKEMANKAIDESSKFSYQEFSRKLSSYI